MECGIVGLRGAGKTSLFNALTAGHQTHAAGSGKPNIGIAAIPDERLKTLATYVETKKVTPATITFVDIPGFDPGLGAAKINPILEHIRQVDALCEVVRCVESPGNTVDPARDIAALEDELILADIAQAESALDKAKRPARTGDAEAKTRVTVLEKVLEALNDGRSAPTSGWTEAEQGVLRSYGLVSGKRVLYVANVDEDDLSGTSTAAEAVREHAKACGGESVALCATIEAELSELAGDDRAEILEGLGLAEPAIGPLARAVCRLLSLAIFYTTSAREIRAWTVAAGATAPQAAGVVHSDMQRGFIRAECYHADDLAELKSEKAIKAAGRLRMEGKGYHIHDGDVMKVLFNV